jgi:2-phospho-L-lactate transferase/gluconeogenesis factor (CofD/UPF0052 family)
MPIISCNQTINIGCELENGERIVGQSNISHPFQNPKEPLTLVDKTCNTKLSHKIKRIFYLNEYYQEIRPSPNLEVLAKLREPHLVIVYGMGSLYTRQDFN